MARKREQTREWLAWKIEGLSGALNLPDEPYLVGADIDRFWSYWSSAAKRAMRARKRQAVDRALQPLILKCLRPAIGDGFHLVFTPEGTLRLAFSRPDVDTWHAAAELINHARRDGQERAVLARLRRCDWCRRFFDGRRRPHTPLADSYCTRECRASANRAARTSPRGRGYEASSRQARRVPKGLAAQPGLCRDPRLLALEQQQERNEILRRHFHLGEQESRAILADEVAGVRRAHDRAKSAST